MIANPYCFQCTLCAEPVFQFWSSELTQPSTAQVGAQPIGALPSLTLPVPVTVPQDGSPRDKHLSIR